jgi:hypothetical protein
MEHQNIDGTAQRLAGQFQEIAAPAQGQRKDPQNKLSHPGESPASSFYFFPQLPRPLLASLLALPPPQPGKGVQDGRRSPQADPPQHQQRREQEGEAPQPQAIGHARAYVVIEEEVWQFRAVIRRRSSRGRASSCIADFSVPWCTEWRYGYVLVLVVLVSLVPPGLRAHQIQLLQLLDRLGEGLVVLSHFSEHFVHAIVLFVLLHHCCHRFQGQLRHQRDLFFLLVLYFFLAVELLIEHGVEDLALGR